MNDSAAGGPSEAIWGRVYRRVIPLIMLLVIVNFIDRSNVGFAALQMNEQLGFSPRTFALGASVFFIGYLVCQIPANLVIHRYGPRLVIAVIAVWWGLTTAAMALVHDVVSFVGLRLLLSIAEAGLMPGAIYYISQGFPQAFRGRAMASLYIATQLAFVIGGPLSGALLQLPPTAGLQPWQIMFIVEAMPAVILGFAVWWWLPDSPAQAKWLSDREARQLQQEIGAEQERIADGGIKGGLEVLRSWRLWVLFLAYVCFGANFLSMAIWLPQVVDNLHDLSPLAVGLISAAPYLLTAILMYVVGRDSDRRKVRGPYVVIGSLLGAILVGASGYFADSPVLALCTLTLGLTSFASINGPFWSFATAFLRGRAAAVGIGLLSIGGSIGGFLATNMLGIVRETYGDFRLGLYIMAVTLLLAAFLMWCVTRGERAMFRAGTS